MLSRSTVRLEICQYLLLWLLLLLLLLFKVHQHKAAGRKTRLDVQNYGCNCNLLCYHGVLERNRISFLLLLLFFIIITIIIIVIVIVLRLTRRVSAIRMTNRRRYNFQLFACTLTI